MPKPEPPGMLLSVEAAGWLEGKCWVGREAGSGYTCLSGCWWSHTCFHTGTKALMVAGGLILFFLKLHFSIFLLAPSDLKGHPRSLSIRDHLSE